MKTKKLIMSLLLLGALPLAAVAQDDDMYFVPTKENVAKEKMTYGMPAKTYYSGSSRSVDDYNRRAWTSVTPIDSTGNDIIDFSAVRGVYPDSAYTDVADAASDYTYTRRMSRFDDYTPSEAYWDGYRDGRWSSPWYHAGYYSWYDPWYWNDPWYYSGYYGWHSPWYYSSWYSPWHYGWGGYYGWYGPRYYGGGWYGGRGYARSRSERPVNHRPSLNGGNYGGYRSTSSGTTRYSGATNRTNNSSSFGGTRSTSSGSSFGGSRSSGGGGSSFGGGRSASGGRSFGGRR